MGSMSHRIAIDLPRGFPGASPSLALTYSSASGSGPLGIGWSMSVPMVGRMTSRGAPNYDAGDLFDVGGQELVQVGASGGDLIYRARFEKGFVRYRWVGDATGAEGYWVGENPDGSVSYYGADAAGTLVDSARKTRPQGGTAEYCLVETVDPYGHSVRYSYQLFNGSIPLLSGIRWLDDGTGADLYAVEIDYEGRGDVLSDASRGYEEITADRLTRIRVKSGAQTVREYVLAYEDDADAGGFSRLVRVDKYGLGGFAAGDLYPVGQRFQYSQALGADCSSGPCDNPYFVEMSFEEGGASFGAGLATLVDINGDALPDILDTSASDGHRFFINTLTPRPQGGFHHGFTAPVASQVSGTASLRLGGMGRVQTFDVNGDGRSDLLSASTGAWLENGGSGDWSELRSFGDITGLSSVDFATSRFIDIDDDKRVDIINSTASATRVYRNEGDRFSQELVSALGVAFGVGVQFADMNGDGLNDPVELRTDGTVRYRLNLGHGQWSADWRTVSGLRVNSTDVARADFEDLNGDNVSDIVIVGQTQVQYAINRNDQFDAFVTITTADLGSGAIPERLPSTTVLYVDMNANGSQDVVWISGSNVSYLEMFPRRPNLLTQIENGIGSVQRITYTTAAEEMARARAAGSPWSASLQIPMQMAKTVDRYVTLTGQADGSGLHELTAYAYRDGYYDGIEKQYRGFERVEMTIAADAYQEAVNTAYLYDVGRTAPHRSGLALSTIVSSDGEVLNETRETYAECELDEVPTPSALEASGRMGVYFVCNTASEIVHKEGLTSASEWKTVRVEKSYDGYGSVTLNAALGVVDLAGDELYTETTYVPPTSRWLIGLPARERVYDAPGIADFSETLTYYDGEAFAGLPNGQATEGFVSRVTHKVDGSGRTLASVRARRDAHGNSVETIDPNGSLADETIHRRRYGYDETGFFLITT
ncbi:MAG: toxin TcdB middle/N-terminal domain-containing protein, partial [Myxococcota bacterium]